MAKDTLNEMPQAVQMSSSSPWSSSGAHEAPPQIVFELLDQQHQISLHSNKEKGTPTSATSQAAQGNQH